MTALAEAILANPDWLEQEASERSLREFVRQYWQYTDPQPFIDSWHIGVLCDYLEAVYHGDIRRLLILIPPRTSKSSIVSVMFPAWYWTREPSQSFLSASYAQSLSIRDSLRCRRVLQSPLYQARYGGEFWLTSDQNAKQRYDNNHGGYRLATSVDGALTGEGANVIIIDDPLNVVDAESAVKRKAMQRWFDESMRTRLNDPASGAFVAIMQRTHYDDFAGHVIPSGEWDTLCLPMRYESEHPQVSPDDRRTMDGELLCPMRFDESTLAELEEGLGSYGVAGQFQQRPAPREGAMFKASWFEVVDAAPAGGVVGRGWDFAGSTTGDYTVGCRMRLVGGEYYIEDIVRLRGTPEQAERAFANTTIQDGYDSIVDIPQDPGQAGLAQARYLVRQLPGYNVRYSPESGDKRNRATAPSAQAEAGNIKLVRGAWNRDFLDEAAMFPNGNFDDQVDGMSRIFHQLTGNSLRWGPA